MILLQMQSLLVDRAQQAAMLGQLAVEQEPVIKALLWVIVSLLSVVSFVVVLIGRMVWGRLNSMDGKLDAIPSSLAAHEQDDSQRFGALSDRLSETRNMLDAGLHKHNERYTELWVNLQLEFAELKGDVKALAGQVMSRLKPRRGSAPS